MIDNVVVFVDRGQVARHVPVAAHHLGREVGPIQIAFHHVRAANQQHALPAAGKILARVDVDHLHVDAGHGLADRADAVAALSGVVSRLGGRFPDTTGDNSVAP